jgi:class 3 adenylate cyclase
MLASQAAVSMENAELYTDLSRLNRAYERFVPRAFLRQLARKSIVDVELGDSVERELSVAFVDLRSFSTISEGLPPAESFRFVNAFLGRMEPIVERHGGFIDKYLGDAVMALFEGVADDAVRAAEEMLTELARMNEERTDAARRIGRGLAPRPPRPGPNGGPPPQDGRSARTRRSGSASGSPPAAPSSARSAARIGWTARSSATR